jgi:hypothetical protein
MEAALARDLERSARLVEQHIRRTVDIALKHVPGLNVLKKTSGTSAAANKSDLARGAMTRTTPVAAGRVRS